MLDLVVRNWRILALADPAPRRRPLPKVSQKSPKIDNFSDLTKWEVQNQEMLSKGWPWGLILDVIFSDVSICCLKYCFKKHVIFKPGFAVFFLQIGAVQTSEI